MRRGASPRVPITSSWSAWPTRTIVRPSRAYRMASRWTFVTSGHVASITRSRRSVAASRTAGDTPWALKMTVAPAGTSSSSSTKMAPFSLRASTT